MRGKRIVLGVTGGIAAYKAASVCSQLSQQGADVQPALRDGRVLPGPHRAGVPGHAHLLPRAHRGDRPLCSRLGRYRSRARRPGDDLPGQLPPVGVH